MRACLIGGRGLQHHWTPLCERSLSLRSWMLGSLDAVFDRGARMLLTPVAQEMGTLSPCDPRAAVRSSARPSLRLVVDGIFACSRFRPLPSSSICLLDEPSKDGLMLAGLPAHTRLRNFDDPAARRLE